jgi:hypothetical protein
LLFTPLFGDYTRTGRIIGFIFRIIFIIAGLLLMSILLVLTLIAPSVWFLSPLILFNLVESKALLILCFVTFLHYLYQRNIPLRRVTQAVGKDVALSFRPRAYKYLKLFRKNSHDGFEKALNYKPALEVLRRAELDNDEFKSSLKALSVSAANIERYAFDLATKHTSRYVEFEHVFFSALAN